MKYRFPSFLIAFSLLIFSSCLTFEESYTFKKNGSGTAKYLIDMSEMSSLLEMASESENEAMGELNEMSFSKSIPDLERIAGISKVKSLDQPDEYLYGITFSFKNIASLNDALNLLMNEESAEEHTYFEQRGNVIVRNHKLSSALDPEELMGDDEDAASYAMTLLESITYKINLNFKKSVKVVYSSAEAEISGKKNREVHIEADLKTLSEDAEALNASIVLK